VGEGHQGSSGPPNNARPWHDPTPAGVHGTSGSSSRCGRPHPQRGCVRLLPRMVGTAKDRKSVPRSGSNLRADAAVGVSVRDGLGDLAVDQHDALEQTLPADAAGRGRFR